MPVLLRRILSLGCGIITLAVVIEVALELRMSMRTIDRIDEIYAPLTEIPSRFFREYDELVRIAATANILTPEKLPEQIHHHIKELTILSEKFAEARKFLEELTNLIEFYRKSHDLLDCLDNLKNQSLSNLEKAPIVPIGIEGFSSKNKESYETCRQLFIDFKAQIPEAMEHHSWHINQDLSGMLFIILVLGSLGLFCIVDAIKSGGD